MEPLGADSQFETYQPHHPSAGSLLPVQIPQPSIPPPSFTEALSLPTAQFHG